MSNNQYSPFLALIGILQPGDLYETRMENDVNGNILYIGKSLVPSASTADPIWSILKLSYDGNGFIDYVQLPTNGAGFLYIWDNRSTYF